MLLDSISDEINSISLLFLSSLGMSNFTRHIFALQLISCGENSCHSIAFPGISTGVYGYPKKEAAQIAMRTVKKFLEDNLKELNVIFVCFDSEYEKYLLNELEKRENK